MATKIPNMVTTIAPRPKDMTYTDTLAAGKVPFVR